MKRLSCCLEKTKRITLLLLLLFIGFATINAQTSTSVLKKKEPLLRFGLPADISFNQKFYPKGISRSFYNFGDILAARSVLPAASFSEGPTSGQYINQGVINQQPVPFFKQTTGSGIFGNSK